MEILEERVEGRYAKVRQVGILRMENSPSNIDFVGKLLKANNDFDQKNEWSIEALACPISL